MSLKVTLSMRHCSKKTRKITGMISADVLAVILGPLRWIPMGCFNQTEVGEKITCDISDARFF